jgi:hypothetical protein
MGPLQSGLFFVGRAEDLPIPKLRAGSNAAMVIITRHA